jgi:CBS domain containing-hemolysin-like protein
MNRWIERLGAFIIATLVTTTLVSLAHSWFVQEALIAIGADMPWGLRGATAGRDLVGLLPTLGPIIMGALLIAFLIAAWLKPRVRAFGFLAYPLAGWAALTLALLVMRLAFGFSPLAGARTGAGFLAMSLGGLIGGTVFALLDRRRAPAR